MTNSNTYISLDTILRRLLAKSQLTLHFYVPFYLHGKDAVKEIFTIHKPEFKVVEVTLTNGVGDIPADCLKVNEVYIQNADRKKTYVPDDGLIAQETVPDNDEDTPDWVNGIYQGDHWASGENFIRSYVEIPGDNKFRLQAAGVNSAASEITKVYLVYSYDNSVISGSTMVHPLAERAIYDFIRWQRAGHARIKRLDVETLKREYGNSIGQFRSATSNLSGDLISRLKRRAKN